MDQESLIGSGRWSTGRPTDPAIGDLYIDEPSNIVYVFQPIKLSTLELMAFAFAEEDPPKGEWVVIGVGAVTNRMLRPSDPTH